MSAARIAYRTEAVQCPECGQLMKVRILRSGAGFYIGRACSRCGPWDRISAQYWSTWALASVALEGGTFEDRFNALENQPAPPPAHYNRQPCGCPTDSGCTGWHQDS